MPELTSVPAGCVWMYEKDYKYWWLFDNTANRSLFYIDEMPEDSNPTKFYQVVSGYTWEGKEYLEVFNTLNEAQHYCHMLILTGAA